MREETVELSFDREEEGTKMARKFSNGKGVEKEVTWIPRSLIRDEDETMQGAMTVQVPEWWASKEGLI